MAVEKSLPRSINVKVFYDGKLQTVKIEKLPLGRAAKLAGVFKSLPKRIKALQENEKVREAWEKAAEGEVGVVQVGLQIVEILPELLEASAEAVLDVLEVGSGLDRDVLESLGLDEASEILLAILTVNNVNAVVQNVKNLQSLLAGPTKKAD